jgi:hypothetical protein
MVTKGDSSVACRCSTANRDPDVTLTLLETILRVERRRRGVA